MTVPTTTPALTKPQASRVAPWLVIAAAVLLGAVLQAASAVPGLDTATSAWFTVQVVASVVFVVAEVCALAWACRALVRREHLGRPRLRLVLWSAVFVLASLVAAVVAAPAVALVLIAALCVLPASAAGERNALKGLRVFRRTPVRTLLASLAVAFAVLLSWVVALVAGFFLTGALGGVVMWLWFGLVATLALLWWTHRYESALVPKA